MQITTLENFDTVALFSFESGVIVKDYSYFCPIIPVTIMDEKVLEKLRVLAESAKYDVSCASSGTSRKNKSGGIGSAAGWAFVIALLRMVVAFLY